MGGFTFKAGNLSGLINILNCLALNHHLSHSLYFSLVALEADNPRHTVFGTVPSAATDEAPAAATPFRDA